MRCQSRMLIEATEFSGCGPLQIRTDHKRAAVKLTPTYPAVLRGCLRDHATHILKLSCISHRLAAYRGPTSRFHAFPIMGRYAFLQRHMRAGPALPTPHGHGDRAYSYPRPAAPPPMPPPRALRTPAATAFGSAQFRPGYPAATSLAAAPSGARPLPRAKKPPRSPPNSAAVRKIKAGACEKEKAPGNDDSKRPPVEPIRIAGLFRAEKLKVVNEMEDGHAQKGHTPKEVDERNTGHCVRGKDRPAGAISPGQASQCPSLRCLGGLLHCRQIVCRARNSFNGITSA